MVFSMLHLPHPFPNRNPQRFHKFPTNLQSHPDDPVAGTHPLIDNTFSTLPHRILLRLITLLSLETVTSPVRKSSVREPSLVEAR
jgi:hypothetical protein